MKELITAEIMTAISSAVSTAVITESSEKDDVQRRDLNNDRRPDSRRTSQLEHMRCANVCDLSALPEITPNRSARELRKNVFKTPRAHANFACRGGMAPATASDAVS